MKKIISLGAFMLASSLFASHNYTYQVTPMVGKNFSDTDSRMLNTDMMIGIRATAYENETYGFQFGYERASDIGYNNSSEKTNLQRFYTGIVLDGEEEYSIVPSLMLGAGYEVLSNSIENEPSQGFLSGGVGFKYYLLDYLNIALETKALIKINTEDIDISTTLGFGIMLDEDFNLNVMEKEQLIEENNDDDMMMTGYDDSNELLPMPEPNEVIKAMKECEDKKNVKCEKAYRLEVFFDYDKSNVKKMYMSEINKAIDVLLVKKNYLLVVEGHTDSKGSGAYNKALSQKRANAVKRYIASKQISVERIRAIGYGEDMPIATNDTEEGRALNRRVVAKFISSSHNSY